MEILLKENVENLGKRGDRVNVAKGYFRNFLLPRGLAVFATDGNQRALAEENRVRTRKDRKFVTAAQEMKARLDGVHLEFKGQTTEDGHLYGSVNAQAIAKELQGRGFAIEPGQVELDEHIKDLGDHAVLVKLHRGQGVEATIRITVRQE